MRAWRRLSVRLMAAHLTVLGAGGLAFLVTFKLLASEVFDRRVRGGPGQGGPSGAGQGLLQAFDESVDFAMIVSLAVGVIIALLVAWFVADRMAVPIARIRESTRAIADGNYDVRVGGGDIAELDALADDVNALAERLEHTEQTRARLLSDVTHELRTPIASIDGFVEGTVDGIFTTDEMFEAVKAETGRMVRFVDDLSVLSRTAEHSLRLDTRVVDLGGIVRDTVDQLRPAATERGVALRVEAADGVEVEVDPDRIGQVVSNLVANAIGHVEEGGHVGVAVDSGDGTVTMTVTDDGEGIPPDEVERVFDRFYRGASSRRRQGTGLGLAVARGIAEAHGGTITASSKGQGTGATFTVTLPKAHSRAAGG